MTPTTEEEKPLILKSDVLGRVHMPKERREAILDAFEGSGISGQAFAKHIGVKYPTFASWVQKRRRERGEYKSRASKGVSPVALLEAVIEPAQSSEPRGLFEVETAQGLKLRIGSKADIALAVELLQALEVRKGC